MPGLWPTSELLSDQCAAITRSLTLSVSGEGLNELIQGFLVVHLDHILGFGMCGVCCVANHPRFFIEFFEAICLEEPELRVGRRRYINDRPTPLCTMPFPG